MTATTHTSHQTVPAECLDFLCKIRAMDTTITGVLFERQCNPITHQSVHTSNPIRSGLISEMNDESSAIASFTEEGQRVAERLLAGFKDFVFLVADPEAESGFSFVEG